MSNKIGWEYKLAALVATLATIFLLVNGLQQISGAKAKSEIEKKVHVPEENSEYVAADPCGLPYIDCEPQGADLSDELLHEQHPEISPCAYTTREDLGCDAKEKSRLLLTDKIIDAASLYDVDVDTALRIAKCESEFDWRASNPKSSAKGVYQFTDTTWSFIKAQGHQFDMDESIKQFMIWYPIHPEWWVCR